MHYLILLVHLHIVNLGAAGNQAYMQKYQAMPPEKSSRVAPVRQGCSVTFKREAREPFNNTPHHHLQPPNGFPHIEEFRFEEDGNWLRRYETVQH
jgi:hypothetical protein